MRVDAQNIARPTRRGTRKLSVCSRSPFDRRQLVAGRIVLLVARARCAMGMRSG
jgi:hypothetical protein